MTRAAAGRRAARGGYHHGDLRRALLDAGRAVLREAGPEGCSLREVARRAGVSHAAPYHHFASREALLGALAAEGWSALDEAMAAAQAAAPAAAAEQLTAVGMGYFLMARRQPALFRLMTLPEHVGPPPAAPAAPAPPRAAPLRAAPLRPGPPLPGPPLPGPPLPGAPCPGPYGRLGDALTGLLGRAPTGEEAHLCWAAVHGLSLLALEGGLGVPEAALDAHARAVLARLAGALAAPR